MNYLHLCVFRHYNPANSTISSEQMNHFLSASFSSNLEDIPGVGKAANDHFMHPSENPELCPIFNAYQLYGKFFSLKGNAVDSVAHCELFFKWLVNKGINHNTSNIVQAVATRANLMMPGIYDGNQTTQI